MIKIGVRFFTLGIIAAILSMCRNENETDIAPYDSTSVEVVSQPERYCSGVLGDVKYSLLKERDFRELNGDCWVIMGDISREQLANSKLSSLVDSIPDARGVFIRGMNVGRSADRGDPSSNRQIGSYQSDMVGPHTHPLPPVFYNGSNGMLGGNGAAFLAQTIGPSSPNDGIETRPRNICLYVYVRIN